MLAGTYTNTVILRLFSAMVATQPVHHAKRWEHNALVWTEILKLSFQEGTRYILLLSKPPAYSLRPSARWNTDLELASCCI